MTKPLPSTTIPETLPSSFRHSRKNERKRTQLKIKKMRALTRLRPRDPEALQGYPISAKLSNSQTTHRDPLSYQATMTRFCGGPKPTRLPTGQCPCYWSHRRFPSQPNPPTQKEKPKRNRTLIHPNKEPMLTLHFQPPQSPKNLPEPAPSLHKQMHILFLEP